MGTTTTRVVLQKKLTLWLLKMPKSKIRNGTVSDRVNLTWHGREHCPCQARRKPTRHCLKKLYRWKNQISRFTKCYRVLFKLLSSVLTKLRIIYKRECGFKKSFVNLHLSFIYSLQNEVQNHKHLKNKCDSLQCKNVINWSSFELFVTITNSSHL